MELTDQMKSLLQAFLESAGERRYGYQLMKAVGLPSGTLYPILSRFEAEGLVTSDWTVPPDSGESRPRRYYTLTALGEQVARAAAFETEPDQPRRRPGVTDLVRGPLRVTGAMA